MVVKLADREDNKGKIIYEEIANGVDYETLPNKWQYNFNLFGYFSYGKNLYDYQIESLKNSIKILYLFYSNLYNYQINRGYEKFTEAKKGLYNRLKEINKEVEYLSLSSKGNKLVDEISRYYDYNEKKGEKTIHFFNFVNRVGFWMATGSGKTLIIVKLIELLDYYIEHNLIPDNDIMVLTYRDDLISQIKDHVEEYNSYHYKKIILHDLRDYDKVKFGAMLTSKDNINIFIYRSDLITDETKEKQLSYNDIDNDGRWYIILDEAHKGNKEDSKRQVYYSLLTRFGFLFNFSATFTDPWDVATTVYNFNLDKFIESGYGKNVYLSQIGINFNEFNQEEKEKVIMKSFILLTATKKAKESLPKELQYHNPLMVIYGNSVNTDSSDLEIVFSIIESIGRNIKISTFEKAKEEIIDELSKHPRYVFAHEEVDLSKNLIESITIDDTLKYIFNADRFASIEVITIPKNNEELIFKMKSSDKPFAMIKIGDIKKWITDKFPGYEINESYDNKSYFKDLNNIDNGINILLGSRAFYEGWDSNRPNVMMFINIGVGDSKKYVLQSIGRGVRIEPFNNERKRLRSLSINNVNAKELYHKADKKYLSLVETLFVFGTSGENIKNILDAVKFERSKTGSLIELNKNEEIDNYELLVPSYKIKDELNVSDIPKFTGNYSLIKNFLKWLNDDRILYATNADSIKPSDIKRLKDYMILQNFSYKDDGNVLMQVKDLFEHVNIQLEDLDKFKKIEDEIVHFKHITAILNDDQLENLRNKIRNLHPVFDRKKREEQLKEQYKNGLISFDEYTEEIKKLSTLLEIDTFSENGHEIYIKNIENHYYLPLIISRDDKMDYLTRIISVSSERKFLQDLEGYLKNNKIDADYWFFSKIEEELDKIYIPYYDKENNRMAKFFPDFIFWIKKGNNYYIVFVDPKGTKHTDYEYKVDGYSKIFEETGKTKEFKHNEMKLKVFLYLYTEDKNTLPDKYKRYWFDNPGIVSSVTKENNH